MIEYIHTRLGQWGRQLGRGGFVRGLGFPRRAAFMSEAGGHRPDISVIEGSLEMHRAVQALGQQDQHLVGLMYVLELPWKGIATELGCCEKTVSNRLHALHVRVMEWLQDDHDATAEKKSA